MKRWIFTVMAVAGVAAAYLLTWPVPIVARSWASEPSPGYTGVHQPNQMLSQLQRIDLGGQEGPEHVVIGPDGMLYTTVASGEVLRMATDGSGRQVFANTQGRVLGFHFDRLGQLIAADAVRGLLKVGANGEVSVLADRLGDEPILYADAVIGTRQADTPEQFFFTDASTRFGPAQWGGTFEASVLDILEQSSTGRVLVHNAADGGTVLVAKGLSFANGIALSADEQTLYVAETGRFRIWAIPASARGVDLSQGPSGGATVLIDNLPGYPDNLMRGQDGRIWAGLVKTREPMVDSMWARPLLREITLRLPRAWWPIPKPYGHVIAFNETGQITADWQDPTGAYPEATSITETDDRVYVQSLHADHLGWMPKPASLR